MQSLGFALRPWTALSGADVVICWGTLSMLRFGIHGAGVLPQARRFQLSSDSVALFGRQDT